MRFSGMLPVVIGAPILAACIAGMTPIPRPEGTHEVENGRAAPFVGSWSITWPTRDAELGDKALAICSLPVRIISADPDHIFYLAPRETEPTAALSLTARDGGTAWEPIAGGPSFIAVWISPDSFYLYEDGVLEGAMPYIYNRCAETAQP